MNRFLALIAIIVISIFAVFCSGSTSAFALGAAGPSVFAGPVEYNLGKTFIATVTPGGCGQDQFMAVNTLNLENTSFITGSRNATPVNERIENVTGCMTTASFADFQNGGTPDKVYSKSLRPELTTCQLKYLTPLAELTTVEHNLMRIYWTPASNADTPAYRTSARAAPNPNYVYQDFSFTYDEYPGSQSAIAPFYTETGRINEDSNGRTICPLKFPISSLDI